MVIPAESSIRNGRQVGDISERERVSTPYLENTHLRDRFDFRLDQCRRCVNTKESPWLFIPVIYSSPPICLMALMANVRVRPQAIPGMRQG